MDYLKFLLPLSLYPINNISDSVLHSVMVFIVSLEFRGATLTELWFIQSYVDAFFKRQPTADAVRSDILSLSLAVLLWTVSLPPFGSPVTKNNYSVRRTDSQVIRTSSSQVVESVTQTLVSQESCWLCRVLMTCKPLSSVWFRRQAPVSFKHPVRLKMERRCPGLSNTKQMT